MGRDCRPVGGAIVASFASSCRPVILSPRNRFRFIVYLFGRLSSRQFSDPPARFSRNMYLCFTSVFTDRWTVLTVMLHFAAIVAWLGQASVPSSLAWSAMTSNTIFSVVGRFVFHTSVIKRMLISLHNHVVGDSVCF